MVAFITGVVLATLVAVGIDVVKSRSRASFFLFVQDRLRAIEQGDLQTRLYDKGGRAKQRLLSSVNDMVKSLGDQVAELSQERDVLRHILHSMTTGVVYIAKTGRIQMVNDAAERLFRRPAEQWLDREHWSVFRDYSLGTAIDNTLLFGTSWRSELRIQDTVTAEIMLIPLISARPTRSGGEMEYDALLMVNDVSEWRRLERMRSEFVADVSHELKTPIAAIRGFAETLLDGEVDLNTQTSFLQTIYDEARRMGALVSDLLELSRLESTQNAIRPTSMVLREVIESAVRRLEPQARQRSIALAAESIGDTTVWAEEDRILQVLLNLLSNAIYYTPEGGTVIIRCDVLIDRVKIHVIDTGIGIGREHLPRVFERFYRVNRDRSRASGGTGLGLAIVKHIVSAHGGEVGVNSELDRGSDFWFTLSRLENTL